MPSGVISSDCAAQLPTPNPNSHPAFPSVAGASVYRIIGALDVGGWESAAAERSGVPAVYNAAAPMSDGSSGIYPPRPGAGTCVASGSTLDGFVAAATAGAGVELGAIEPLTSLVVETCNTRYHIIVRRSDEIVIQGGTFFPDPTLARFEGASLGSSLLRLGWIGLGLRMEIRVNGQRIVTTPVRTISRPESGPVRPP